MHSTKPALAIAVAVALSCPILRAGVLFEDDFSRYPAGWLTYPVGTLNEAIQEYHWLSNRGAPLGPWANAITHLDAWVAGDEDGKTYVEQQLTPSARQFTTPIFITGDPEWSDYTVEVKVKPLSLADMAGVVFRYHTNRHYYLFALAGGNKAILKLHLPLRTPAWRDLGSADFAYDTKRYYTLRVENDRARIRAFVDGKQILEATNSEIPKGKAGLAANIPARYQNFRVTASGVTVEAIRSRIQTRKAELARLRAENPKPKLWKRFNTPNFGAGRNVRFGGLDRDGQIDMLIAQSIPRVRAMRLMRSVA